MVVPDVVQKNSGCCLKEMTGDGTKHQEVQKMIDRLAKMMEKGTRNTANQAANVAPCQQKTTRLYLDEKK